MIEKFTFFFSNKHYLSQWHMCKFVIDDIEYNCTEQYMMAEKAKLFKDEETRDKIMNSFNPKEQKNLGRKVKNFSQDIWNQIAGCIVYRGNFAKFNRNQHLKDLLVKTKGTTLVEASPYDSIWGIGLTSTDPRSQNRKTWKGKNWLGKILTRVRDDLDLIQEEELDRSSKEFILSRLRLLTCK